MDSHKLKKPLDNVERRHCDVEKIDSKNDSTAMIHGSEVQLQAINACVAQLLLLEPPEAIRKELAAFVVCARKILHDPVEQAPVFLEYSRLQGEVLEYVKCHDDDCAAEPQGDIENLFSNQSLEQLPPYSSVSESIENILSDMLIGISVPEEAVVAFKKARQLLDAGLNWYELAALLEQVAIIMGVALHDDEHDMQLFLQVLDERLRLVNSEMSQLNAVAHSLFSNEENKDAYFRKDIHDLTEDVIRADSLQVLKSSVLDGLDSMQVRLDQLRDERCVTKEQYEARIEMLQARINALEALHNDEGERLRAKGNGKQQDGLTGLPNRASYNNKIESEIARWKRDQHEFCLVIADIDHFGLINNQHGSLAADKVLSVVAKTIRQQLRRIDFIARYSGNTFGIILPDTNIDKTLSLMNELGEKMRSTSFHYKQAPLNITISFGITQMFAKDDGNSLLKRANKALCEAKAKGHDQAIVAP